MDIRLAAYQPVPITCPCPEQAHVDRRAVNAADRKRLAAMARVEELRSAFEGRAPTDDEATGVQLAEELLAEAYRELEVARAGHDTVYLRRKLDLEQGMAIKRQLLAVNRDFLQLQEQNGHVSEEMFDHSSAVLARAYLVNGVAAWTLVDEAGADLPVTPENVVAKLVDDYAVGEPVVDAADDLYKPVVLDPLRRRALTSSPPTRTDGAPSTSPTNRSTRRAQKPPKRSSTGSSPTAVTEATSESPSGVSS